MSIPLTFKREELIAKLESLRPAAEKADKAALAKHKLEEQAYLKAFKQALREASKWDYETLKKNDLMCCVVNPDGSWKRTKPSPSCPRPRLSTLEHHIALVKASPKARYEVTDRGKYSAIYHLLTIDAPEVVGMC
jgi:hypothetical protein